MYMIPSLMLPIIWYWSTFGRLCLHCATVFNWNLTGLSICLSNIICLSFRTFYSSSFPVFTAFGMFQSRPILSRWFDMTGSFHFFFVQVLLNCSIEGMSFLDTFKSEPLPKKQSGVYEYAKSRANFVPVIKVKVLRQELLYGVAVFWDHMAFMLPHYPGFNVLITEGLL